MSEREIAEIESAERAQSDAYAAGLDGAGLLGLDWTPDAIDAFAAGAADRRVLDLVRRHGGA
jgi:hypothetical protein